MIKIECTQEQYDRLPKCIGNRCTNHVCKRYTINCKNCQYNKKNVEFTIFENAGNKIRLYTNDEQLDLNWCTLYRFGCDSKHIRTKEEDIDYCKTTKCPYYIGNIIKVLDTSIENPLSMDDNSLYHKRSRLDEFAYFNVISKSEK